MIKKIYSFIFLCILILLPICKINSLRDIQKEQNSHYVENNNQNDYSFSFFLTVNSWTKTTTWSYSFDFYNPYWEETDNISYYVNEFGTSVDYYEYSGSFYNLNDGQQTDFTLNNLKFNQTYDIYIYNNRISSEAQTAYTFTTWSENPDEAIAYQSLSGIYYNRINYFIVLDDKYIFRNREYNTSLAIEPLSLYYTTDNWSTQKRVSIGNITEGATTPGGFQCPTNYCISFIFDSDTTTQDRLESNKEYIIEVKLQGNIFLTLNVKTTLSSEYSTTVRSIGNIESVDTLNGDGTIHSSFTINVLEKFDHNPILEYSIDKGQTWNVINYTLVDEYTIKFEIDNIPYGTKKTCYFKVDGVTQYLPYTYLAIIEDTSNSNNSNTLLLIILISTISIIIFSILTTMIIIYKKRKNKY